MKRYSFFVLMMLCVMSAKAQQSNLPAVLASSINEFSGMCLYKGRLFLLPQLKNAQATNNVVLYSIDTARLETGSDGNVTVSADAIMQHPLRNFTSVVSKFQKYGGFEAIAAVGNGIYLTVETDSDTDAIVCGRWENNELVLNEKKIMKLPKVRKNGQLLSNAGYENLTTHRGKLLTAFEYNYKGDSTRMYLVDTNLNGAIQPIPIASIPFRLTDITPAGENKYLAINVYWNFNGNMQHREAYYKEIDASADADLRHWKPNECFARIIEIKVDEQKATWQTIQIIPANDCINWEGIVFWRGGVLMVSDDNKLPFLKTKLRYYSLTGKP